MTQTLSMITKKCVIHVSDRLLTQGATKFDRNSNKTIVFRARDAQVIVAYSGRAFLDSVPTDTFIAQALIGVTFPKTGAFIAVGRPDTWVDIGRAVERLRTECEAALRRLGSERQAQHGLKISVLGWRQRRTRGRKVTPLVWTIEHRANGKWYELDVKRHTRWWAWNRSFVFACVPEAPPKITEAIRAALRERGGRSLQEAKSVLVDGIRRCAEARPEAVSHECLCVVLTPTAKPQVRIEYLRKGEQSGSREPSTISDGYSPWIVAPPMAWPPGNLRGAGGWAQVGGDFEWKIEQPELLPGSKRFEHTSQIRPRDPQSKP